MAAPDGDAHDVVVAAAAVHGCRLLWQLSTLLNIILSKLVALKTYSRHINTKCEKVLFCEFFFSIIFFMLNMKEILINF